MDSPFVTSGGLVSVQNNHSATGAKFSVHIGIKDLIWYYHRSRLDNVQFHNFLQ